MKCKDIVSVIKATVQQLNVLVVIRAARSALLLGAALAFSAAAFICGSQAERRWRHVPRRLCW
ncbi:hypothetical protein Syncc8109_1727 [Synechococcus sp. WH 8109]|nr:hypothetical protein Syncc8109_1727 [Synechococcus sp. WH 8109]